MSAFGRVAAVMAVAVVTAACGQKGPPLAPLHLVPAAPGNVAIARSGGDARLRFDVPSTNLNGSGPVAIDRIEVYAATVAAGAARPANRELLTAKYRVASIPLKPPPVEGEAAPANAAADDRPSAGERTAFVEALTEDKLRPVFTTLAPKPVKTPGPPVAAGAEPTTPPATVPAPVAAPPPAPPATGPAPVAALPPATVPAPAAALPVTAPLVAVPDLPTYAVRIYAVRGLTKSGRAGQPSTRVELPVVAPPAPPGALAATFTETDVVLSWMPPVAEGSLAFNVYKSGGTNPVNATPVSEPTYVRTGLEFGTEECFVLRSLQKTGAVDIESESSPAACVTPRDAFPPAAPKGMSAVAGTGIISLSWDANTEGDLAGYLVLRGEAPGDTLQPLMAAPMTATSYEDKTVRAGLRYAYAIIAVDKASPPNRSAQSARVEETAR